MPVASRTRPAPTQPSRVREARDQPRRIVDTGHRVACPDGHSPRAFGTTPEALAAMCRRAAFLAWSVHDLTVLAAANAVAALLLGQCLGLMQPGNAGIRALAFAGRLVRGWLNL